MTAVTAVTAVLLRKSDREFRRKCPRKMLKFTPIERIVVALTSGVVTLKKDVLRAAWS